jgi:hypothetical protein
MVSSALIYDFSINLIVNILLSEDTQRGLRGAALLEVVTK